MNGISQKLGYAGLIPFVFFALSVLAGSTWAPDFFTLYSALILSFMAGACWALCRRTVIMCLRQSSDCRLACSCGVG